MRTTQNYNFEDLVRIGYRHPELSVEQRRLNPILAHRNGDVKWVYEFTLQEMREYRALLRGIKSVTEATRESNVLSYKVTYKTVTDTDNRRLPITSIVPTTPKSIALDTDSYQRAGEVWKLPDSQWPLSSYAALFYLMYYRALKGDKNAQHELDYLLDYLTPILKNYLDMAAGGEARHMLHQKSVVIFGQRPDLAEIEEEALASKHLFYDAKAHTLHIMDNNKRLSSSLRGGRSRAWVRWYYLRQKAGVAALDWGILVHAGSKSSGFGGNLWANSFALIRKLERGEISPMFFVDQAFSLEHNGGNIFNKMWNISSLNKVLDAAFSEDMLTLEKSLIPSHRTIWRRVAVNAVTEGNDSTRLRLTAAQLADFRESSILRLAE